IELSSIRWRFTSWVLLRPRVSWPDASSYEVAHLTQQLLAAVCPLLEDLFYIAIEALAVVRRQVPRCDHHDRNWPPCFVVTQRLDKREAIHLWHHEIEQDQLRPILCDALQGDTPIGGLGHRPPLFFERAPQ